MCTIINCSVIIMVMFVCVDGIPKYPRTVLDDEKSYHRWLEAQQMDVPRRKSNINRHQWADDYYKFIAAEDDKLNQLEMELSRLDSSATILQPPKSKHIPSNYIRSLNTGDRRQPSERHRKPHRKERKNDSDEDQAEQRINNSKEDNSDVSYKRLSPRKMKKGTHRGRIHSIQSVPMRKSMRKSKRKHHQRERPYKKQKLYDQE